MRTIFLLLLPFLVVGCSGVSNNSTSSDKIAANGQKGITPQLNISILLDLSDRVSPEIHPENPEHYVRDIASVKEIVKHFVKEMESKGVFMSKGKIKVIFSPKPQYPDVNTLAGKLNIDLSKMNNKQKKNVHDSLEYYFDSNLSEIYKQTIANKNWIGSDIWRFFKNDVVDYCIDSDTNYRNILVILTDGYLYHIDSKDQIGNRYAYVLPSILEQHNLRKNPKWENIIKQNDIGLITKRNDLNNLEIAVLEISPSEKFKNDEDIIKCILSKWFEEMKVKKYAIFNSDLPEYTKQRIDKFLK